MDVGSLRGLYDDCTAEEREQTRRYFEQLKNSAEGWKICATDFTEKTLGDNHVRFFSLQVIEHYVRTCHASSSDDDIMAVRKMLLSWALPEQGFTEEKVYVRNKMAQIFALVFVIDYPTKWPSFFSDLLQCIQTGSAWTVELYLRILLSIDGEVVDRQVIHSAEENSRNTIIKDTMRDHCVSDLVESWFQIMTVYETQQPWLTSLALQVVGAYVLWIEVSHIANDRFVGLIFKYLSVPSLRESAAECLHEIVSKGMDPVAKTELVEGLQKLLESVGMLSPVSQSTEEDVDFQVKLSKLVNGMGVALVVSWNKLLKGGDEESAKVTLQAIEAKLPYLLRYLSDDDDGVSEAVIPFTVQYLSTLKHRSSLTDIDRGNLQTLLMAIIGKLKYDEGYNFLNEGEEEILFIEYRKELKAIFDNIALLDSQLVLQSVEALLSSTLADLSSQSFSSVEVSLRVFYMLGEVISEKQYGGPHHPQSPWHRMLMTVFCSSVCSQNTHFAVLLQYFEVIVRYAKFFHQETQLVPQAMEQFLGGCGLRHTHCSVRSRLSYLLLRFLKVIKAQVSPVAGQVLQSLQELLLLLPGSSEHRSYLSTNDLIFLYEAAGFLVASLPLAPEGRRSAMSQVLAPLLGKVPLYLEQLDGTGDPSQQEELGQVLHCLLSLISRTSKVFPNHQLASQSGCLECYMEAMPIVLRGLEVGVQREVLQSGVRQFLHRMTICMGDELLSFIPTAISLLLNDCKLHDILEFIPLINQLVTKYKAQISPVLQEIFTPVVQTIGSCLSVPFDPADLEEQRERRSLQKAYFLFINAIATYNIPEVIANQGSQTLEEVLGSVVQGAVGFGEPSVQKVCFSALKRLVEAWAAEGTLPGFVEYMYGHILPACFVAPLDSNFDVNDGHAFLALGEIAGVLKTIVSKRGVEAVLHLQNEYLPSLSLPPELAQDFVEKLQKLEMKALKTYLKALFLQLRTGGMVGNAT